MLVVGCNTAILACDRRPGRAHPGCAHEVRPGLRGALAQWAQRPDSSTRSQFGVTVRFLHWPTGKRTRHRQSFLHQPVGTRIRCSDTQGFRPVLEMGFRRPQNTAREGYLGIRLAGSARKQRQSAWL